MAGRAPAAERTGGSSAPVQPGTQLDIGTHHSQVLPQVDQEAKRTRVGGKYADYTDCHWSQGLGWTRGPDVGVERWTWTMEAAGVGSSCQKGRVPHQPPEAGWGLVGLFADLATRGPFLQEDQANYFPVAVLIWSCFLQG